MSDKFSQWVKISKYGFVHRQFAEVHYLNVKTEIIIAHCRKENRAKNKAKKQSMAEDINSTNDIHNLPYEDNDCVEPEDKEKWVDIDKIPFYVRQDMDYLKKYIDFDKIDFTKIYHDIEEVVLNPNKTFQTKGAFNRFPVATT